MNGFSSGSDDARAPGRILLFYRLAPAPLTRARTCGRKSSGGEPASERRGFPRTALPRRRTHRHIRVHLGPFR
ncbi:hypothetical protein HMPREF9440_01989, partial [Sutterella parvirubra YIT 11816]